MKIVQVSRTLYRSDRPTTLEDMKRIKSLGVNNVINLQGHVLELIEVQDERIWAVAADVGFTRIPMNLLTCPTIGDLELVRGHTHDSVCLVHCREGDDRTGCAVLNYRIKDQQWSFPAALAEMVEFGFHLRPYEMWLHTLQEYYAHQ